MKTSSSRLSRLARTALPAAPLALVAVPSAHAAIIYTNPADLNVSVFDFIYIDMGTNGAGGSSSTSSVVTSDFRLSPYGGNKPFITSYPGGTIFKTGAYARKFAPSELISGLAGDSYTYLNFNGNNNANWAAGTTGYLGVQFNGGSGTVNGWIQVSYNGNQSLTLYDFAYESSGGGIAAGAGVVVPEPSAYAALAGLLAGSAALYAKRRQQKKAA